MAIRRNILACGPCVSVVTGFFDPFPGGLLDQVGRDYIDLCAALVVIGLNASELQIWKEYVSKFEKRTIR